LLILRYRRCYALSVDVEIINACIQNELFTLSGKTTAQVELVPVSLNPWQQFTKLIHNFNSPKKASPAAPERVTKMGTTQEAPNKVRHKKSHESEADESSPDADTYEQLENKESSRKPSQTGAKMSKPEGDVKVPRAESAEATQPPATNKIFSALDVVQQLLKNTVAAGQNKETIIDLSALVQDQGTNGANGVVNGLLASLFSGGAISQTVTLPDPEGTSAEEPVTIPVVMLRRDDAAELRTVVKNSFTRLMQKPQRSGNAEPNGIQKRSCEGGDGTCPSPADPESVGTKVTDTCEQTVPATHAQCGQNDASAHCGNVKKSVTWQPDQEGDPAAAPVPEPVVPHVEVSRSWTHVSIDHPHFGYTAYPKVRVYKGNVVFINEGLWSCLLSSTPSTEQAHNLAEGGSNTATNIEWKLNFLPTSEAHAPRFSPFFVYGGPENAGNNREAKVATPPFYENNDVNKYALYLQNKCPSDLRFNTASNKLFYTPRR
jgi:hypothetical protein